MVGRKRGVPVKRILVSGASGFVGRNLVLVLLKQGYAVRAVGRDIARLRAQSWAEHSRVELVETNAHDACALTAAMRGCDVAYYLIHSMEDGVVDFHESDLLLARNFRDAAQHAGVHRIVYLGGLGLPSAALSAHLRSRHEVAETLGSGAVPVTHLRAAMIIGKGSASYEVLSRIAETVPIILLPSWASTQTQPIALENALRYLCSAASVPAMCGQTFDIGGPVRITYRQLLRLYVAERKLRRVVIGIPSVPPLLGAFFVRLAVPLPLSLLRPLLAGVRNRTVCHERRIVRLVPQRLLSPREALRAAIRS